MRKTLTVIAAGLFVLALAPKTEALTLTFDTVFSGATPSGSSPYLTATFTDAGSNTVNVTLTGSIDAGEFYTEMGFNLDPALSTASGDWTFNYSDGDAGAPSFNTGTDAFKADGDGFYDMAFVFQTPNAQRFTGSEVITFSLVYDGLGTFNANSFNYLSLDAGGHGPFSAAAHVQGIAPNCSGWVAPVNPALPNGGNDGSGPCSGTTTSPSTTPETTPDSSNSSPTPSTPSGSTPEPGLLTLLGTGLVMAGRRMRRQKA